jgi:hypothetical protein
VIGLYDPGLISLTINCDDNNHSLSEKGVPDAWVSVHYMSNDAHDK